MYIIKFSAVKFVIFVNFLSLSAFLFLFFLSFCFHSILKINYLYFYLFILIIISEWLGSLVQLSVDIKVLFSVVVKDSYFTQIYIT